MPHYFDPEPRSGSEPRQVTLALPDMTLALATDRGVFAAEGVDPGTRLLLLEGPAPPDREGHLVDLGAGYGPIALALARRAPRATVWAVEVNGRARELCARNARDAGAANVVVAAPEEVPPDLALSGLWSNPPIRIGKAALHRLLADWCGRLAPGAAASLVVHKHLGSDSLARWLAGQGWAVERLVSRRGYRLLRVRAPGPAAEPDDRAAPAAGSPA